MRVLGIDPGSLTTGWGLVCGPPATPRLLDCGEICLRTGGPLAARLARLQSELGELLQRLRPTEAAVESPFHGASARSALQLAHARGVILAVLAQSGLTVAEYTPATVKQTVAGSGRAGKPQIAAMTWRLLGQAEIAGSHDVTDALAVALCHLARQRFDSAVGRAQARSSSRGRGSVRHSGRRGST